MSSEVSAPEYRVWKTESRYVFKPSVVQTDLLALIEELYGFLRGGTFDAAPGEMDAQERTREILRRYGRMNASEAVENGD